MAKIFRKLENKRHWDQKSWLGADDVQADATQCLRAKGNKLSVYVIDNDKAHTDRVVAALALTRDHIAWLDLAIFPEVELDTCAIKYQRVQGDTPDVEVNKWHMDLEELTIGKIGKLALTIQGRQGEIRRYTPKEVVEAVRTSLSKNEIDKGRINPNLVPSLVKRRINLD